MQTDAIEIILGNSNKRFSGVTSTMLQVLPHQQEKVGIAVLGSHHMPTDVPILSFLQFIRLCKKPLSDGRYRVFHARRNDEMIQALVAKKLFGAKIKIAFTSTAQRHHSGFSRWLMRQMDAIISTCNAAASYLIERKPDIIIPHGVDTTTYRPAASRQSAWEKTGLPGSYGIGTFGRVRHSKGIDILVQACIPLLAKFPGATVIICGECIARDQPFLHKLQEQIKSVNLSERFIFLGKQPFTTLPALFQSMSIVTALSREEGFGLTPLEAMASGTAVLTSEAGAWQDIIRNGVDGYCVPTNDVEAVSSKLNAMLSDLDATHKMGMAGRQHMVDQYTVEHEAEALVYFLKNLSSMQKY